MVARIAQQVARSMGPPITSMMVRTTLAWLATIIMSTATSTNLLALLRTEHILAPFAIT
jgi:hypothetical protein